MIIKKFIVGIYLFYLFIFNVNACTEKELEKTLSKINFKFIDNICKECKIIKINKLNTIKYVISSVSIFAKLEKKDEINKLTYDILDNVIKNINKDLNLCDLDETSKNKILNDIKKSVMGKIMNVIKLASECDKIISYINNDTQINHFKKFLDGIKKKC